MKGWGFRVSALGFSLEAMNLGKVHLWAIFIHLDAWILHQGLISKWAVVQAVTVVA